MIYFLALNSASWNMLHSIPGRESKEQFPASFVQCAESKNLQGLSLEVSQDFSIIFHLEQCSVAVLVAQLYPTVCHPTNCSLPGSCVHGILQARILEWIAIPFSRASS
ncbi:unnamed protein product [Rangifer tarandus platyrhynchus]|uniref:Uncharacterized protein n=2 Tax=Rangifer tarandus platyrhynchus TaxID=3082113 RepID=A0ABN8YBE1_RANTA|nr:unnamed protein product [Rangifer tarandus platyrhynchus]